MGMGSQQMTDRGDECGPGVGDEGGESVHHTDGQVAAVSFLKSPNFLTPPSFKTINTQAWRRSLACYSARCCPPMQVMLKRWRG